MMVIILIIIIMGIAWAIREHLAAKKYRYLIRLHKQMGPQTPVYNKGGGPQWTITYKEKGKLKTITLSGATEGEAIKTFINTNSSGYGSIVKTERA